MADTVDIQNLNLTMGEIKALLMSINTERKDDRRTTPPDMSELKKILEDAFKPFTEEMKANTKAVEGMKELTKAIEESNNLSKNKKSKPTAGPTGPTVTAEEAAKKAARQAAKQAANRANKPNKKPTSTSTSSMWDDWDDDEKLSEEQKEERRKENKKNSIADRKRGRTRNLVSSFKDVATITDDVFAGVGDAHEKAFKGIIKDERTFVSSQKDIAYETTGALSTNKKLLSEYTLLEKTSQKTGASREEFQKNLGNALKSGNRELKMAKAITTAQLNTEKQLGLEAGELSDTFQKLNTQYGMSEMQIAEMGRGMREVAKNSGLTGKELSKAVQSSMQFIEAMRNAGQLTSAAAKNIQSISASAQKFGIEKELAPLLTAMSSSTDLMMKASSETKNFLFISANAVGRTTDLINGSILKTKQGTKDIAKGMRETLKMFGVESLEAIEGMTDAQKFNINMTLKTAFGIEVDQAKRQILSLEEGTKTLSEKLADLNKEKKKNLNLEEKAIIVEKERSLKLSASFAVLTVLDEASKNAKNMGEAFANFNARASTYADELNVLGLTAASDKEVAKGAFVSAINNINQSLKAGGKKELKISSSEIEKAINDPEAMRVLSAKLTAKEQEASTAAKAQLDPARSMEQTLREYNDYFRTWSGAVLTLLGTSQIGNAITGISTVANIAATTISKGINLRDSFESVLKAIKAKWREIFPPRTPRTETDTTVIRDAIPPNAAETATAKATEDLDKKASEKNCLGVHDYNAAKILNKMLESLKSIDQSINKCCVNKNAPPATTTGKSDPMAALTQRTPTAVPSTGKIDKEANDALKQRLIEKKAIREQEKAGIPRTPQAGEKESADKSLQRSKDKHERKMIKDEKFIARNAKRNVIDDKITNKKEKFNAKDQGSMNRKEKGSIKNQGAPSIMGFDISSLSGQAQEMAKAAPAIMIIGAAILLLGTALVVVGDQILKELNLDVGRIMEVGLVIAAVAGAGAAFIMGSMAMIEQYKDMNSEGFTSGAYGLAFKIIKMMPAMLLLGLAVMGLGAALIAIGRLVLSIADINTDNIVETGILIGAIMGAAVAMIVGVSEVIEATKDFSFTSFAKNALMLAGKLALCAVPLLLISAVLIGLGAALIFMSKRILDTLLLDSATIQETTKSILSLILGLTAIMASVALATGVFLAIGAGANALFFGPQAVVTWAMIGSAAAFLIILTPIIITLAAMLVSFCAKVLESSDLSQQKIEETITKVITLIAGLTLIAGAMALALWGLMAAGGQAILFFTGPGILASLKLIAAGSAALFLAMPLMLYLASTLMKWCAGILSGADLDTAKIKETVETVTALIGGLGLIAVGMAAAIYGMYALGLGANFIVFNPLILGAIAAGAVALNYGLPFFLELSASVFKFCSKIISGTGLDKKQIDETTETIKSLFGGLGTLIFQLWKTGGMILYLLNPINIGLISLAFGVFLPYATEMISGISVFIIDFVKELGKLIKNVSNQVGGLKGVEFLAKFSEDMTKAIISVIEMVRVIGSSLVSLTAPKYIFWGNSVMDNIKEYSAGFSESMEVICRDVVKKGIIDPILNNFNKSGMKQTSQALRASVLISKALSSIADMLETLGNIVTYFGKDTEWWTPWRNPSIEQIKELGMSFSKHFATIIVTLNNGIIQPLVDNFKNLKSLGIAASAAKGIGAVFSGIAEFLKAYSEQIKPLTDKKGWIWQTSGIEDIKTSLDSLSAPLTAIYGGVKTLVESLNIGKKDMKDLDKILPSLDMFTKLAAAMGTMSNQMLNLQKNTEKTEYDTDNSIMANIYFLRAFTTGISKADKAAQGSKDMAKTITSIILNLSSVINAMEAALKSSNKDPKSLEESIKRFEQLTTITSKVSSMIDNYNTSAKTANEIKTNKNGGFAGASKNIKEAVDQTYDFVKIITKAIDTKGKYQEIKNAFAAVTGLSYFMKSMLELIKNISETMESLQDLDTEMYSIGKEAGKGIVEVGEYTILKKDKLKDHLKEIVTFVVEFSSAIIEVLKAQKLPDVKGMEQEVAKLNILIEAIAAVGKMMLYVKRLNEVQDELNKQLGGGKVQAQGYKGTPFMADRGDKIKDIKTSMGENIKTVIELSSGIIETIQKLPIGDLKGVSEAVKKLEECAKAILAVRFLFTVINGNGENKGLNEIMQELEVSLAKSESSGGGGDFGENIPTAISGIKNSLGKPITQVLELLQTIISEVGGKLSGLKGDEVQKLIFIGNMLQVFKNITSSIKTLFLDQTEIIEDPVTKTKKLASVSEAIANGQTDFVKYIGSIGSLIKGIVDAIKDPNNFADSGSVEQVKSKMLPTLEIMENLAEMLVEINQHIRNIYKNYRDVAINACIGFSSDGPMAHVGSTINFKIVQDIINNFPTTGDLDESLDISYETLQRLNRMVYNLQGIHIKVEQIYKDYKASAGAYASIKDEFPIHEIGVGIWNNIVWYILSGNTWKARKPEWETATGIVEDTYNGLQIISQKMSLIHMEVEQIYKDYKANISIYNGLRDESIFKVVGIAIWNHIVNSIFANFAEKSHWERATAMVEMTADGLEFMKHHMSSIKESCEELISLNENFAEILNSNAIETIGKSILENILDPIEIFMPSNEKIGKTVKRIDMITTGIMMLSDSLMLLKNSIESIGNLGSSIGNMFSNFIGFGKEISQPIDSKINILSEPSEQFTDQRSINSEPRNSFTDLQKSINSEPRSSFTDLQKSINSEPRSSINNQEWNKRSTSTNRYSADESLSSKFRGDGMSDDEMKQRMIASAAGIDPSEISMPSKKAFTDENQWNKRSMATKPYSIDESLSSKFRGDGMSADEMKQNIITSSSGVDVANEIRREKATSEVNVKPSYSMDEINNVANLQLKEQQKMVELLQKINDKMEQENSTSNPSGDSDLGDSDTASKKINKKPINLYKWGTGQFHRGSGVGLRNTGDGGPR